MSTRISSTVSQWLNFVQFVLLPPTCVLCQRPGQRGLDLCLACQQRLPQHQHACPVCALPLPPTASGVPCGKCLQQKRRIHATVAAASYSDEVSRLVTGFKYHRQLAGGRVLTALLIEAVRQRYHDEPLPQLLLPVPLHDQTGRAYAGNAAATGTQCQAAAAQSAWRLRSRATRQAR